MKRCLFLCFVGGIASQAMGWVQDPTTGHWYTAVATGGSIGWNDAKTAAEGLTAPNAMPVTLALITSAPENDFVFALINDLAYWSSTGLGLAGPWIGGYQDVNDGGYSEPLGAWKWVTGEPFSYNNWRPGEPNNNHVNGEDYIHYIRREGTTPNDEWNDVPQTGNGFIRSYVAEAVPEPGTMAALAFGAAAWIRWRRIA